MNKYSEEQINFIKTIAVLVQQECRERGYKYPSAIIAQASVESFKFKEGEATISQLAKKYNNFFGMKTGSKWTGKTVDLETGEEYTPGVITRREATFRVYDNIVAGVKGYFDFISKPRYDNLKGATSPEDYLTMIKLDGYATSSKYVQTCLTRMNDLELRKYDTVEEKMMKAEEMVNIARDIALHYKTLYIMGCFGAPMTASNKNRYLTNHDYNKRPTRQAMIKTVPSDTFGFDCSGLIKGILWGWGGNFSDQNGGAVYASNGVPDINANEMIRRCSDVSDDFSNVQVGELLWTEGHIGIYAGDNLAIECSPSFANRVQITVVGNMKRSGGNVRVWKKHGKFKYVDYEAVTQKPTKTTTEIAKEVIAGKWGNMPERKQRLESAGYNYNSVRVIVNRLAKGAKENEV